MILEIAGTNQTESEIETIAGGEVMMCEYSVISRFEQVNSIADGANKDFPLLILSSTYRNAMREIESFVDGSNPNSIKFNCGTFVVNGCKIIPFSDYRKLAGYDRRCKLLRVY